MKINIGKDRALTYKNNRYKSDSEGCIDVPDDDVGEEIKRTYGNFILGGKVENKKLKKKREVKHDA